jgi:hypothetical protein
MKALAQRGIVFWILFGALLAGVDLLNDLPGAALSFLPLFEPAPRPALPPSGLDFFIIVPPCFYYGAKTTFSIR